MKTKIIKLLANTLMLATLLTIPMHAEETYYADKQVTVQGFTILDRLGFEVTLHASGYSDTDSGRVERVWMEEWHKFPYNILDQRTWTEKHPLGEYAKGSFTKAYGVNSSWGNIGITKDPVHMTIAF